jgi:hypothetical protein
VPARLSAWACTAPVALMPARAQWAHGFHIKFGWYAWSPGDGAKRVARPAVRLLAELFAELPGRIASLRGKASGGGGEGGGGYGGGKPAAALEVGVGAGAGAHAGYRP